MAGDANQAATIVQAILDAKASGDEDARRALIDPEILYVNTGFAPFELKGRDAYLGFIDSLHDIYTAPRKDEYLGIDALSPSFALLRGRVTIGDVTSAVFMFHYVTDGRVTEVIDVFEDRGRSVVAMIDPQALAAALQGGSS